jgi:VWFA-related protein
MRRRILNRAFLGFVSSCALILALVVNAQDPGKPATAATPQNDQSAPATVFHANTRLVVLDVIVTDHHGQFVPGLKPSDFTILEDNKPQKVSAFAAQVAAPTPKKSYPAVTLPPHQFTNFTPINQQADRPVTVILMDLMNTSGIDQAYARKQMIHFLEKLPEGQPVALFVLTSKLSMIQGFSGDSGTLVAAAKSMLRYQSPLLSPEAQQQQEENVATAIENVASPGGVTAGPSGGGTSLNAAALAPIGQALRNALAAQDSFQKLERMGRTLSALESIARAVAGYPGRKNLIWLSAEFPVMFAPGVTAYGAQVNLQTGKDQTNNQLRDIENDSPPMHQTAALLAAVRLAVYPIDVRGQVSLGTGIDISAQTSNLGASDIQSEVQTAGTRQTTALWDAHEAMADIARETGGKAFYGTNDLKDAMTGSMQQGSSYYTLAYSPTNKEFKGKYRKIEVKAATPGVELTYRRGYYAFPEQTMKASRAAALMTAAMQPTIPEFTGLLMKVQVLPPDVDHKTVQIDYAVDARDISFSDSSGLHKLATIGFAATAWDKDLKLAAQLAETKEANYPPEVFQQVLRSGVTHHQELELKPGKYTLRLGVLDLTSRKIGSVAVPITIPDKGSSAKGSQ